MSALLTLFTKINVQIKKCGYIGDLPCKHCSMFGGSTSHHPKLHLLIRRELNSFNVLVLFVLCFLFAARGEQVVHSFDRNSSTTKVPDKSHFLSFNLIFVTVKLRF